MLASLATNTLPDSFLQSAQWQIPIRKGTPWSEYRPEPLCRPPKQLASKDSEVRFPHRPRPESSKGVRPGERREITLRAKWLADPLRPHQSRENDRRQTDPAVLASFPEVQQWNTGAVPQFLRGAGGQWPFPVPSQWSLPWTTPRTLVPIWG
jgi:hypothetical protein